MALVPKQTKAETKLMWGLTMGKFVGVVMTMMLSLLFGNIVHSNLRIVFMIVCVVGYLLLNIKSPTNPQKAYWQGVISFFTYLSRRKVYYSLHSDEYIKTVDKEASDVKRKQEATQTADRIKSEHQRAKETKVVNKILGKERKARQKQKAKDYKRLSKMGR